MVMLSEPKFKTSIGGLGWIAKSNYHLLLFLVTIVIIIPSVTAHWDPYQIIGVKRDASLPQIKKAYRELARRLHPDKSNDEEANKKFIELNKAFNILKDPSRRSRYDKKAAKHLPDRIFWRLIENVKRFIYYMSYTESFTSLVLLGIFISFLFYKSPTESNPQAQTSSKPDQSKENTTYHNNVPLTTYLEDSNLKLIELKAETYNGMVRLLKPGYRSIVLLTDCDTKEKLLPVFRKSVWPYRRNKTLLFGYLCLDKNLNWYKSLLQQVTGFDELKVNKKYCNGTVLSLNGFKKYFRVYHAKHHEINHHNESEESFLGFDDENESDDIEKGRDIKLDSCNQQLDVDKLLKWLPIWLDKMFDGLTKRYLIDEWPEEMN